METALSYGKNFTFFSNPHNSHSRIDCFLVSRQLISSITSPTIGNIDISDHAMISLVLNLNSTGINQSRWRMNTDIILNETNKPKLLAAIQDYFILNPEGSTSMITRWDAFKAYIRGVTISIMAYENKKFHATVKDIQTQIAKFERLFISSNNPQYKFKLQKLRYEFNSILSKRAGIQISNAKARFSFNANRSGKLLANYLRIKKGKTQITSIHGAHGKIALSQNEIVNEFLSFYSTLYNKPDFQDVSLIDSFLKSCDLPKISQSDKIGLDAPISKDELLLAIKSLKKNKSPGPDGIPAEFYKEFHPHLLPFLHQLFMFFSSTGITSGSFTEALIIVLPKPDKDPTLVSNYRPISLINQDCKLYAKILANRLGPILDSIIHMDQSGFMKNRYSSNNTRTLLHVIEQCPNFILPSGILALDAEKAFDKIHWQFLFHTLSSFNFGDIFIRMISALYFAPTARLFINGHVSSQFSLFRGTRQGCPLSPLLFLLGIEPLLAAIRNCVNITGVTIQDVMVKTLAYADDVLIFINDPLTSFPSLMEIISIYSAVSGYTLNTNKTEFFPLNVYCTPDMLPLHDTIWQKDKLKYLGTLFSSSIKLTLKANCDFIINYIKDKTSKWSSLHLSWWGRMESIKMTIAPKIFYTLAMIPIQFPLKFYKDVDKLSQFLWNNKSSRISYKTLKIPKRNAGFGLPDFLLYHKAFILKQSSLWFDKFLFSTPPIWLSIEKSLINPLPFPTLLSMNSNANFFHKSAIIKSSKMIFNDLDSIFMVPINNTGELSLWYSNIIKLNRNVTFWSSWIKAGIFYLKDVYANHTFISFESLQSKFGLSNSDLSKYQYLCNSILDSLPNGIPSDVNADLTLYIQTVSKSSHGVSLLYKKLSDTLGNNIEMLSSFWNNELSLSLSFDTWKDIWLNSISGWLPVSIYQTNSYILYNRLWTPSRLFQSKLLPSAECWHCKLHSGTLQHMLYDCPLVFKFWQETWGVIRKILHLQIDVSFQLIICKCAILSQNLTDLEGKLLNFLISAALKSITFCWKDVSLLSVHAWWSWVVFSRKGAQLSMKGIAHNSMSFQAFWRPVDVYLSS